MPTVGLGRQAQKTSVRGVTFSVLVCQLPLLLTLLLPVYCIAKQFSTVAPPPQVLGRNCRFLQGPDTDPRAVQVRLVHLDLHQYLCYSCFLLT